jgi:hypothetical protein
MLGKCSRVVRPEGGTNYAEDAHVAPSDTYAACARQLLLDHRALRLEPAADALVFAGIDGPPFHAASTFDLYGHLVPEGEAEAQRCSTRSLTVTAELRRWSICEPAAR